ncbi:hypothetical protein C8J38_10841 [Rhizobium sp. PP-WC-2G-219]|nr:hypothetical protein C8J38_10841 [Rhizobium sp. PP-WC-2G-219]
MAQTFVKRPKKVAIVALGQSLNQGPVLYADDFAAYPQAFRSLKKAGVAVPMAPDAGDFNRGGWWPKVFDDMLDEGYELEIVNCAIGGMDALLHLCGFVQTWTANTGYYQKRPASYPDRGDFGDIVQIGTRVFNVTVGRLRTAISNGPAPNPAGGAANSDYIQYGQTSEATGATQPDVSSVAIGGTIVDGGITFTRLNEALYQPGGTFDPTGTSIATLGGVLTEYHAGRGFDPLGILARAYNAAAARQGDYRFIYWDQGQSNLGASRNTYGRAVRIMGNYFARRNIGVILGNTTYSPASSGSIDANYQNQILGVADAIADLNAAYPGKAFAGANLYAAMGSTGVMGGQQCTASVSGTTLTVTALKASSGTGLAAGQTVWNTSVSAAVKVAKILTQLGGTAGGIGTYQLDASATVASTSAIISAGDWLQFDGIHIRGAGAVGPDVGGVPCAAKAITAALKLILPDRKPLVVDAQGNAA